MTRTCSNCGEIKPIDQVPFLSMNGPICFSCREDVTLAKPCNSCREVCTINEFRYGNTLAPNCLKCREKAMSLVCDIE